MRKIVLTLCSFVLALQYSVSVCAEDEDIKQQVLTAFESLVQASKNLDTEAYFAHFDHDKFTGLNSDGSNWNSMAEFVPLIIGGFSSIKTVDSLEFPNVKVTVLDDYTAILANEYQQTITLANDAQLTVEGGGVQVWSKRSGDWKIVSVSAATKPSN